MIEFDSYKQQTGVPIYLQIVNYIKRSVAAGSVKDGDELPSRRWLSARLGINPNTVQKAFSALELEGLIVSKGGSGSVFTLSEEKLKSIRAELHKEDLEKTVTGLKSSGLSLKEAVELMIKYWEVTE